MSLNFDSRRADERDDAIVGITRGMLKQLLREAFAERISRLSVKGDVIHPSEIDVPFVNDGEAIEGALLERDGNLSLQLVGGREIVCDNHWPDEIE